MTFTLNRVHKIFTIHSNIPSWGGNDFSLLNVFRVGHGGLFVLSCCESIQIVLDSIALVFWNNATADCIECPDDGNCWFLERHCPQLQRCKKR